jgi:hypothetical protein
VARARAGSPAANGSASSRFWLLNMAVIWRGIETIKFLEGIGAPFMLAIGCCCSGGSRQGRRPRPGAQRAQQIPLHRRVHAFFIPSLTGMVGFWATVALNIPDFTRYAKSQKAQIVGQALGLPAAMTLYSFIGVAVTSASVVIFGEAIWDPVALLGRFHQPVVASIALVALLVATLNTNVAANVVSPSNDFSNLNPRLISFRTGGLITGVVGVLMMPWKLLTDFSSYIFGWLVGYSGLLGPIAGVMIADYFLVRRARLNVDDLYRRGGIYEYRERHQSARRRRAGRGNRGGAARPGGSRRCAGFTTTPGLWDSASPAPSTHADAARRGACLGGKNHDRTDCNVSLVSFYIRRLGAPEGRLRRPIVNPATGEDDRRSALRHAADVDRAVRAAHEAFLKWRDVPVVDRVQPLYRFKALLEKHAANSPPF